LVAGDPEDRTLRHVEVLLIENMMRDRSLKMCHEEKKGKLLYPVFFFLSKTVALKRVE